MKFKTFVSLGISVVSLCGGIRFCGAQSTQRPLVTVETRSVISLPNRALLHLQSGLERAAQAAGMRITRGGLISRGMGNSAPTLKMRATVTGVRRQGSQVRAAVLVEAIHPRTGQAMLMRRGVGTATGSTRTRGSLRTRGADAFGGVMDGATQIENAGLEQLLEQAMDQAITEAVQDLLIQLASSARLPSSGQTDTWRMKASPRTEEKPAFLDLASQDVGDQPDTGAQLFLNDSGMGNTPLLPPAGGDVASGSDVAHGNFLPSTAVSRSNVSSRQRTSALTTLLKLLLLRSMR